MYGIEYEDDILLLLRMIKFLHMQSPDAAHIFCQSHPVVDMEELLMVIDEVKVKCSLSGCNGFIYGSHYAQSPGANATCLACGYKGNISIGIMSARDELL